MQRSRPFLTRIVHAAKPKIRRSDRRHFDYTWSGFEDANCAETGDTKPKLNKLCAIPAGCDTKWLPLLSCVTVVGGHNNAEVLKLLRLEADE